MSQTAIADRIKLIMDESGMTTTEFSNKLGVQRSGLSHVFNGRNRPGLDLILRIVKVFPHVSYSWLLDGKKTEPLPSKKENSEALSSSGSPTRDTNVTADDFSSESDSEDLFSREERENEFGTNVTKEEEQAPYATLKNKDKPAVNKDFDRSSSGKKALKVIVLYNDGSFEAFDS